MQLNFLLTKGIGTEVYKAHEFVTAETNQKKKNLFFAHSVFTSYLTQFDFSDLF